MSFMLNDGMAEQAVEGDIVAQGKQMREAKHACTIRVWRKLCTRMAVDLKSDCG